VAQNRGGVYQTEEGGGRKPLEFFFWGSFKNKKGENAPRGMGKGGASRRKTELGRDENFCGGWEKVNQRGHRPTKEKHGRRRCVGGGGNTDM